MHSGWCLGQEQFWMDWEERRQDFYYKALFIIGSIWSMSTCQICNIIWEPADGAVTDSIQRVVYFPQHVFPSWGKYHFIVRAVELFVARCWKNLFFGSKSAKLEGHLSRRPRFSCGKSMTMALYYLPEASSQQEWMLAMHEERARYTAFWKPHT